MPNTSRRHHDPGIEANRQLADERTELLEVIRELVDQEIKARLEELRRRHDIRYKA